MDLVIYAAQLSQSFFSDLAVSVEGFLDLYLMAFDPNPSDHPKDEVSVGDNSSMVSSSTKKVPASALAAIVLWCDSELAKFSSAFGGTRILGNLAISPPPRRNSSPARRKSRKDEQDNPDSTRERTVGLCAACGHVLVTSASTCLTPCLYRSLHRQLAIEVAAQCIDQAFHYATANLDAIGLPLAPRLAEYMR